MKYFVLILLLLSSTLAQASAGVVRFGVMAPKGDTEQLAHYAALQHYLASELAPDEVQLVFIEPENVDLADIKNKTDFLLTDPYHYLRLNAEGALPAPLLSQVTLTKSGVFELAGGVIFCRPDNALCDLGAITQAHVVATGSYSLLGYVAQLRELQQLGIHIRKDLVHHLASDEAVVTEVLTNKADIGFIRSGTLEKMTEQGVLQPDQIKILNTQELAELPVQSSSRLYPDWPVLAMPGVPQVTVNRVMALLLGWEKRQRPSGITMAFSAAANYKSVEYTLQALDLPPYQHTIPLSFMHSWTDHRGTLLFVSALLILLLFQYVAFKQANARYSKANGRLQVLNKELTAYKHQIHTVLNNTTNLLLLRLDKKGRITHFNENALKLLHASEYKIKGQVLTNLLPDADQQSSLQAAMRRLQNNDKQTAVALNLKIQLPNGKELYLDSDLFHLPATPGDSSDFVLLGTDVSRRYWIENRLHKSFTRLDQLLERSPSVIYAFDPVTMRLNYISPNCFTMYLKSSMEIMRMANWWCLSVHPDNYELITKKLTEWAKADYPGVLKYSCTLLRNIANTGSYVDEPESNHQQICIETQLCALRDEHGSVTEVIGSQLDISERYHAQMKQELAASVFVQAREGIFITDANGTILDLNQSFCRITGYTEKEALGRHLALLGSSPSDKLYFERLWQELTHSGLWEGEIHVKRKNAESMVLALTISVVQDNQHQAAHYVALFSDITIQKAQEDKLRFIAHFDALTGLPNRLLLKDRIEQNMALAKRRQQLMAVIFIDIDGFKAVNDNFGHEAGDYLLVELANRMRCVMRENDTLARLGGDEFIALLTELPSEADCIPLIERLLQSTSTPVELQQQQARVTASIGITFYPQNKTVDDVTLIRQADMAMYQAKRSGKNQYAIFNHSDTELVSQD